MGVEGVNRVVDAHGMAMHLTGVVGLHHFADSIQVSHPRIEPEVIPVWIEDLGHVVMDS